MVSESAKDASKIVGLSSVARQVTAQLKEEEPDRSLSVVRRRRRHRCVQCAGVEVGQGCVHYLNGALDFGQDALLGYRVSFEFELPLADVFIVAEVMADEMPQIATQVYSECADRIGHAGHD